MENNPDKKQTVRTEVVDESGHGQRIDNFLLKHLKGVPKSHLYKLMRKGQVRVNGKRIKPAHKLLCDDRVRIPPVRFSESKSPPVAAYWLERFADCVLYEDDRMLVINKPAGVSVHRGSGVEHGVIDILKASRDEARHWSLVHRLDRDTSGCLLIAKQREALLTLQDLFRNGSVHKEYLALTVGEWPAHIRTVDYPLRKNVLEGGERIVVVDRQGKPARSHFSVVETCSAASLMRVEIETGRTHQIRVHAQRSGHPVVGDQRYGDKVFNRAVRKLGLQRLFLHAARLEFSQGHPISVECPLAEELQVFFAQLKTCSLESLGL